MSATIHTPGAGPVRRRWAQALLWCVAPAIGLFYQIASEIAANRLAGHPFDADWLALAMRMPWVWTAIALEVIGLVVWLVVLSEFTLGAAFSISALSYVLVIAASWLVFHEPASWLQVLGGGAILAGIWAIATDGAPSPPQADPTKPTVQTGTRGTSP